MNESVHTMADLSQQFIERNLMMIVIKFCQASLTFNIETSVEFQKRLLDKFIDISKIWDENVDFNIIIAHFYE